MQSSHNRWLTQETKRIEYITRKSHFGKKRCPFKAFWTYSAMVIVNRIFKKCDNLYLILKFGILTEQYVIILRQSIQCQPEDIWPFSEFITINLCKKNTYFNIWKQSFSLSQFYYCSMYAEYYFNNNIK